MVHNYEFDYQETQAHNYGSQFVVHIYEFVSHKNIKVTTMDHNLWSILMNLFSKKINFIMMDHNLWSILMNLFSKKINFIMMDHNLWSILMNLFFK